MSASEINKLKLDLIGWIQQMSDREMLNNLVFLKNAFVQQTSPDKTGDEDLQEVLRGLEEADEGKTMSSEDFWKAFENDTPSPR